MTFEENFPELKEHVDDDDLIDSCNVELHCLSKQKVKEKISTIIARIKEPTLDCGCYSHVEDLLNEMMVELGLE